MDVLDDMRARARALHRSAKRGEADALARLGREAAATESSEPLQRRHCLAAVAKEHGFGGWSHLTAVLAGRTDDFGTTLYPRGVCAHSNIWSASHEEAAGIRREHGGYLLAYKRQFFVADRYFVETIGLDPDDPDWERAGRDWAQPGDLEARNRLYGRLMAARE